MKIKKILFWIPVLAIMITIFCFSAQDADTSSQTSGGFSEFLARLICPDFDSQSEAYRLSLLDKCQFAVRKAAHFSIYAAMGFFAYNAMRQYDKAPKKPLFAIVICMLYSISDEFHQSFVPGRSCELRDVIIDTCGALAGIVFLAVILYFYNKHKIKHNVEKR